MNSPELSLDMNLDSPSAADDVLAEGEGGGCGENNASTVVGIIHHNHYQQREGHTHCNDHISTYSSFGSGGSGVDIISGTNFSALEGENQSSEGGAIKIDCDKMTNMIEDWKDELSMMRVKNAILLDQLVKVGANV